MTSDCIFCTPPKDRLLARNALAYGLGDGFAVTLRAYTRYVEGRILWEYVQQYGERAALHYKKKRGRDVVDPCCAGATKGPTKGSMRGR
jgi:hypothetical protein